MLNLKLKKIFWTVITLLIVSVSPIVAANSSIDEFKALSGQEAANFVIPDEMRLVKEFYMDKYGLTYERYQQLYGEAQVLGGQITIYKTQDGTVKNVIGNYFSNIAPTNTVGLTKAGAKGLVDRDIGAKGQRKRVVDLMINPDSGQYFYRIETLTDHHRWFHWINAENGGTLNKYDGLAHSDGTGVDGGSRDLTGLTTFNNSLYEMISSDGRLTTYDAKNRNKLPGVLATDDDDTWDAEQQAPLVDAHFYASVTDHYLNGQHGFNWFSHYSQGMVSSAHLKRNYNNAYWNGYQMAYGDGDGTTFTALSGDLDVVGHELTHGVTDATSNLIYQNESGALNEAFSDIMGSAIEFHHYGQSYDGLWTIGEDITPNDNGIRNMEDPGEDGDPSHYSERYTGTGDNGGVHTNSGIANHWFYLLVKGGQNSDPFYASGTDVSGIGLVAAEQIAFLGFTGLTVSADFCAARASTIAVALNLALSVEVDDAWDEVGVNDALCNGGGGGDGSTTGPVITDVTATSTRGTKFKIRWYTDIAATGEITFSCCGTYAVNSTLETEHSKQFNGSKGYLYEYFVKSTAGSSTTDGPYYHQN